MINKDELSKKIGALLAKIQNIGLLLEFIAVFSDVFKLVAQLEEQVKSAKDNTTFWYNEATKLRDKNIGLDDKLVRAGYELDDAKKTLNNAIESCNFWAEKARARYDEVVEKEGQLARIIQQLEEANEKIAKQQEVIRAQSEQVGFWHDEALKRSNEVAVVQSLVEKERSDAAYWKMMYDGEKAGAVKLNQVIDELSDRNDRLKAENDVLLAKRNFTYNFSGKYVYFP